VSKPALRIQATESAEGTDLRSPTDIALRHYEGLQQRVSTGRVAFGRPLTTAEKALVSHLRNDGFGGVSARTRRALLNRASRWQRR
jgi:hypothetical protein